MIGQAGLAESGGASHYSPNSTLPLQIGWVGGNQALNEDTKLTFRLPHISIWLFTSELKGRQP